MKSNIRVFRDSGTEARGRILPLEQFCLCSDLPEHRIQDEIGTYFVQCAEEMLEETIPLLPLSLYRDFARTGVRSRFEKPHHRRRMMLMYMTMAEAYERKGRFTEKIADVLWAILEESTWVLPAHCYHSLLAPGTSVPEVYEESQMPGLDLYAANCCATVALTLYLLRTELDGISPILARRAEHTVHLRGIRPFVSATYSWSGESGGAVNNWVTNITSSILFAAAVTVRETELRTRVAEKAMRFLDNFTAHYPADGCCDEGPGYWSGAGGNYFDCLELLEDMSGGTIRVYSHPLVRNMGEYIANAHIDGRYYLNFADAHPKLEQDGKLIVRYGQKCGSEELTAFGKAIGIHNPIHRYYFFGMVYRELKNAMIPPIREGEQCPAKTALWYEGSRIAVFREHTDTSRGLYLAVKGGHNRESHNHNDVGCAVVFADGQPLLVDPSHGSYDNGFFGPTRYGRWYMKSSYHSIPTVNGIEQKAGEEFASSEEHFDAANRTVSMELKNAFPAEAGIISMRRTASLQDGAIRITDDIRLEKEGEIEFHYVTPDEPKMLPDGTLSLGGRTFSYSPADLAVRVERVTNTWLPYEDLNFRSVWGRDCLWRICLSAKASEKTAAVTIR